MLVIDRPLSMRTEVLNLLTIFVEREDVIKRLYSISHDSTVENSKSLLRASNSGAALGELELAQKTLSYSSSSTFDFSTS